MRRRLPPLNALRAFEAVARHLSMVRAAEELHVTPAAVSQQIKQLEHALGQPLFKRGKTLALSDPAKAAAPLLADAFDRLERAAAQLRIGGRDGPLVVSTPPAFAARWLVPRLEDFHTRHPEIELRLLATRRLVDFALEDVDAAIRFGTGDYPGLRAERLMPEAIIPVAAPDLAEGITSAADIATRPLLNDEWHTGSQVFPDWETWLTSLGVVLETPLRIQHFGESNLTIQAAVSGLGIALVWRSLVLDDLQAGRLVRLLDQSIATRMAYHLVMPPSRAALAKVAAFRQWLLEKGGIASQHGMVSTEQLPSSRGAGQ
ncbi:MAG: transcriptional regulator GcvA [Betaproteobacteria bacterium]|nr:transcriptional regulator GcvA [Betaproteobacteria bacterium]